MAYQANAVPNRDSENKWTWNTSLSANSPNCARNYHMCSCVFLLCSPENFVNSGILVPWGTSDNQIGCHRVFDMTVLYGSC
jgi:hypothetical protein